MHIHTRKITKTNGLKKQDKMGEYLFKQKNVQINYKGKFRIVRRCDGGKIDQKAKVYLLLLSQLKYLGLLKFYPIFVYHDATSYFFLKIVLTQITQKITINRVYADPPH